MAGRPNAAIRLDNLAQVLQATQPARQGRALDVPAKAAVVFLPDIGGDDLAQRQAASTMTATYKKGSMRVTPSISRPCVISSV
jgi:hypothetical protein